MNLCLTLAEESLADLQRKIESYAGRVAHVEVRLDRLRGPALPSLPASATEIIATCRPEREGGGWAGSEGERLDVLRRAAAAGFHWVDVEHDVDPLPAFPPGVRIVRSRHRFDGGAEDATAEMDRLAALPGDLSKLAVSVSSTRELSIFLLAMERWTGSKARVALAMGPLGQASRYLGGWLGNHWTYVGESRDRPAAPGQFDLRQAETCLWNRHMSAATEIYGVLGRPVAHSLSPALHNGLFEHYGLDKAYFPLELDDPAAWFSYLARTRLPFKGFSVTLPFKHQAVAFLESVDSPVDAVNTLRKTATGWAGGNTDLEGFLRPLRRTGGGLAGRSALVLGCGGVARSVVRALLDEGMAVTVSGRDSGKAFAFALQHGCGWVEWKSIPSRGHLLVNTTPVGQFPEPESCPVDASRFDFEIVYDLVYHPRQTRLLRSAQASGARVVSGFEMFLEQGMLQFETWTGVKPDRALAAGILERALLEG